MNNSIQQGTAITQEPAKLATPLHVLVFVCLSAVLLLWGTTLVLGYHGLQFQSYLALLSLYAVASAVFVAYRIRSNKLQLFAIPVFFTCMAFLQFGLAPLYNFIAPAEMDRHLSANGEELIAALTYVMLGMAGFWAGCQVAMHKPGSMGSHQGGRDVRFERERPTILTVTLLIFAAATGMKYYLLKNQLYGYVGSGVKYYSALGHMQILNVIAELGTSALIIAGIERYRKKSNPTWKVIFWTVFFIEVFWGAISGSKGAMFRNCTVVAVVSSLVERKLNLRWLLLPLVGVILLYPVSDAYRHLVRGAHNEQIAGISSALRTSNLALDDATRATGGGKEMGQVGFILTLHRLDLLSCVANVLVLGPRADSVRGDTPWWMVMIFPFVPRILWPSKPILNEATRFTIALGGSAASATAVTYPGDLYLQFGLLGVPIGMFLLGWVAQWFTNVLDGPMDRRDLFLYVCLFLFGFSVEQDVFVFWSALINNLVIFYCLRAAVYGPRRHARAAPAGDLPGSRQA